MDTTIEFPSQNWSRTYIIYAILNKSKFKPPGFREYFVFYILIRKDTNLKPPDLDSPQKYASGDI
jgi:hypothetical protein